MTEYKKLCALVEELVKESAVLIHAYETDDGRDVVALHSKAVLIRALLTSGRPRVLKILQKGREKDPDKQIYNERMSEAIEVLFGDFCAAVETLFGAPLRDLILSEEELECDQSPILSWAEDLYDEHMLLLAHTEAWQKRLASNIVELVLMEEESRVVYAAEEKRARGILLQEKHEGMEAFRRLLDEREAAKWHAEKQRREVEHMELVSALGLFGASPVSAALASVLPPFRESLASNLLQLVRALRATPEDDNIRRVRCGNLRVMAEYGHAGFCSACPTCQSVVSAAEVLWYMLGYRVEYTSVPAANLPAVVQGNPDLCLPCKRLALNHTFVPVGFEDYSERLFTLREPDPSEAPGEWMGWYSRLEDIMHGLEMIVA